MKNRKTIIRVVMLALLVVAAIAGYVKYEDIRKHETTDDAYIEGDISPVLPKVPGYITRIYFEDNQLVKKGDTLIKLDDTDLRIKLQQAVAALQNAQANLDVIRANVNTAGATIGTAQSAVEAARVKFWKANQDFIRFQQLFKEHSVTQQQFDAISAEKEAADAQYDAARKQLATLGSQQTSAQEQVKVAQAAISQRQADVDLAKLSLSYTIVLAPVDGIVSKKSVQVGQFVQIAQPLCSVVASGDKWVVANFKETQLSKMHEGENVTIKVDAFDNYAIHGRVVSFSGATGAKFSLLPPDNATGNFVKVVQRVPVKIALDAKDGLYKSLRPGMSVSVSVDIVDKG